MVGISFENEEEFEEQGYGFWENDGETEALITRNDWAIAKICCDGYARLSIEVKGEILKNISSISINTMYVPKGVLLDIITCSGEQWWCEFPLKERQPIFWPQNLCKKFT